jgi:asparagine synthase (glutamine-hydrolysing)
MGGFAGLLRWNLLQPGDVARVREAGEVIAHRGKHSSVIHGDLVAICSRSNTSPSPSQTSRPQSKSLLVFDGVLFNQRELREELALASESRDDLILALYAKHGEELLPRLNGSFGLALWDGDAQKLLLARDAFGGRALYFSEGPDFLAFASEAKALFALGIKPQPDLVAIHEALTYRYVPPPRSGFLNVEKLPPGNIAWWQKGTLQYRRWSRDAPADSAALNGTERDEQFIKIFREMLDGLSTSPHACEPSTDVESALIFENLSGATNTPGSRSNATDLFAQLPQVVWHADEPFFDSVSLRAHDSFNNCDPSASLFVSRAGAAEIFGGHARYRAMQSLARYARMPALIRRLMLGYANWRHPIPSPSGWDRLLRWLEKSRVMDAKGQHPYIAAMELFGEEQKSTLYAEAMNEATEGCDAREYLNNALLRAHEFFSTPDATADAKLPRVLQRADCETSLPGQELFRDERAAAAHGLEACFPFLHTDLAAIAKSLPAELQGGAPRELQYLQHIAGQMPRAAMAPAQKPLPLDECFRDNAIIQRHVLSHFESSHLVADKLFHPRFWEGLWTQHRERKAQNGERIFALLALELWYRTFISGNGPTTKPSPLSA